jgi:hypothetical protein
MLGVFVVSDRFVFGFEQPASTDMRKNAEKINLLRGEHRFIKRFARGIGGVAVSLGGWRAQAKVGVQDRWQSHLHEVRITDFAQNAKITFTQSSRKIAAIRSQYCEPSTKPTPL